MDDRATHPEGDIIRANSQHEGLFDFSSHPSENDEYNEEELKKLAESLAPRVTSLLNSNEQVLENLLSIEQKAWEEEEEKFQLHLSPVNKAEIGGGISDDDDDEDGMDAEWNRLSVAEDSLREELEMSDISSNYRGDQSEELNENSLCNKVKKSEEINDVEAENVDQERIYTSKSLIDDEEDSLSEDEEGIPFESGDPVLSTEEISRRNETISNNVKRNSNERFPAHSSPVKEKRFPAHSSPVKEYVKKSVQESPRQQRSRMYTLYDHARVLGLEFKNSDLGYPSCPLLSRKDVKGLLNVPNFNSTMHQSDEYSISSSGNDAKVDIVGEDSQPHFISVKNLANSNKVDDEITIMRVMECTREYVKPMKETVLAKIFAGFDSCVFRERQMRQKINATEAFYTPYEINAIDEDIEILPVRSATIRIRPDTLCGAVMDSAYTAVQSVGGEVIKRQGSHLRALVPGCCIAEENFQHFRPNESSASYSIGSLFSLTKSSQDEVGKSMALLPPFLVDVQLCMRRRSRDGERLLLVRSFRLEEGQLVDGLVCPPVASSVFCDADKMCGGTLRESAALFQRIRSVASIGGSIALDCSNIMQEENVLTTSPRKPNGHQELRNNETYAQKFGDVISSPIRLFGSESSNKQINSSAKSRSNRPMLRGRNSAEKLASEKLMGCFKETPSVQCEHFDMEPIPALSVEDWPFVQSTWRFLKECVNELDNRDLAYSTLVSCPFGAFPALPTIDAHYCSQMKVLCRDNMISSLVNAAQELEQFAKEAEYSCAILIRALGPSFVYYQLDAPPLPESIPLTAYPLDFEAPEASSWGPIVSAALNRVAADSSIHSESLAASPPDISTTNIVSEKKTDNNIEDSGKSHPKSQHGERCDLEDTEFDRAQKAVSIVLSAFHKQEDVELSARLCRKNVQVMDRLAKMQAHKRESITMIRDSYGSNITATEEADKLHDIIQSASKNLRSDERIKYVLHPASDQVPLMTTRILFGHSPGTCYVTAHQMILVTQLIPLIGMIDLQLMSLSEIEIEVSPPSKSLLNPLPATIMVYRSGNDEKNILKFRPSVGAEIFKQFIDSVKAVAVEKTENLNFSSKGGLLDMIDENDKVAKAALGSIVPI